MPINFGQRMLALKLARQNKHMDKIRELMNPYATKIRPELREAMKKELAKMEQKKELEIPPSPAQPKSAVDKAIDVLMQQLHNAGQ